MQKVLRTLLSLFLFFIVSAGVAEAQLGLVIKQKVVADGPAHACLYPSDGWMCQDVQYGSTGYTFEIRYNLVGLSPSEHVIFGAGSYFSGLSRSMEGALTLQDILAGQNIRSYDVQITGYELNMPIVGAPNSSVIVAALVQYISDTYNSGNKVKMVTYDYSSTLTSYALAYHGLENDVDEVIFLGGPVGFNYKYELYNSSAPSYISTADRAIKVEGWTILDAIMWINGWDQIPPCFDVGLYIYDGITYCEGQVELDTASMFSDYDIAIGNADLSYAGVEIHDIIGNDDVEWFKDSSKYWYDRITAASKTRDVIDDVDHFVYESDAVLEKVLERLGINIDLGSGVIPDAVAPTKPTSIVLEDLTTVLGGVTPPSVGVNPEGAQDNLGIHHYKIYRDGVHIGDAYPGVTFRDWNIAGETKYTYTAKAVDAAGNTSTGSSAFSITTKKLPTSAVTIVSGDEVPWIESVETYQMGNNQVFSVYDYGVLTCRDNKDGVIKGKLVVTHNIPSNPAAGTYQATFNCTDSDGNKAATKTAQIVVVNVVPAVVPDPDPQPNPDPDSGSDPVELPSADGEPDLGWLYGEAKPAGEVTPGGLVPCGDEGEPSCQFCHGVSLLENVLDWLAKILTIIATIIFVYAGVRMVISVGDAATKQAAKKLVINAATGLTIVLAAWLFIDILLQSLLGTDFQFLLDDIKCVSQPVSTV